MTTHSNATPTRKCQDRPTVERLRQMETYRQIKAEAELASHFDDAQIITVIRNNKFEDVSVKDLTEAEIRSAYTRAFHTYEGA